MEIFNAFVPLIIGHLNILDVTQKGSPVLETVLEISKNHLKLSKTLDPSVV